MRINQFLARGLNISRRQADELIKSGQITKDGQAIELNYQVKPDDQITYNNKLVKIDEPNILLMLNKPTNYVCSRDGQGSKTIYDLLPSKYQNLKTIGRLDKDSSGLLLLTNDGQLNQNLSHPKFSKAKVYVVGLNKVLKEADYLQLINGVELSDGLSRFELDDFKDNKKTWKVTIYEGRNRQIRRTFASLGYQVINLHRTNFAQYDLNDLASGLTKELSYN